MNATISTVILVFVRIAAFIMVMPMIGTKLVPPRIKVLFAVFLTAIAASKVDYVYYDLFSLTGLVLIIKQFIIGLFLGVLLQVVFGIFQTFGEIISYQCGLSFAQTVDPSTNISYPMLGQFYLLLLTVSFFAFDLHLILIRMIIGTIEILPLDYDFNPELEYSAIMQIISFSFAQSVKIVLPILLVLMITNAAFGVVSKVAPQLNLFSLGLPLSIFIAFIMVLLTLNIIYPAIRGIFADSLTIMNGYIGR